MRSACEAKRLSSDPARARTGQAERGQAVPRGAPGCPSRTAGGWRPDRPRCCGGAPTRSAARRGRDRSNIGPRSQASMKRSTSPDASSSSASVSSDRRRRSRAAGSSMPAVTPMKTTPRNGRSVTDRHVQGHPGAERVAEQRAAAHRRSTVRTASATSVGRRRQVGPHRPRIAVTGQIHRDQRVRLRPAAHRSGPRGVPSG